MHASTRPIMDRSTNSKIYGIFTPVFVDWERERAVLDHVDRDAGISMRQVGEELNVSHVTLRRAVHDETCRAVH
jgi:hypothetical protein